jgi:hypothetical protein
MDTRSLLLCFSFVVLALTGLVYGVKFLRKRNYLLGVEWLVIGLSSTNFTFFFLTGLQASYNISFFLDAFSRGSGIPVIATAGLMVLTHGYKPSLLADVLFFVGALAFTCVLVGVDAVAQPLPYFYVVMWAGYSIYLAYFARRLLKAGEPLQALNVSISLVAAMAIAAIYDFYKIPGDDTNLVFNFYFLAGMTWAYQLFSLYHAYDALERAQNGGAGVAAPSTVRAALT